MFNGGRKLVERKLSGVTFKTLQTCMISDCVVHRCMYTKYFSRAYWLHEHAVTACILVMHCLLVVASPEGAQQSPISGLMNAGLVLPMCRY